MTRKRFKLSLAALCLLTAFFMALIGLLLAPTLASAEKNSGTGHQQGDGPNGNGSANPVYWEHASGHEPDTIAWNPPTTHPCAGEPCGYQNDIPDTEHFEGGSDSSGDPDHSSSDQHGNHEQGGNEGNGSFPNGRFASGGGSSGGFPSGSSGGFPGGSSGGENPHDQLGSDHNGNDDSDNSGPHDGDHHDSGPDDGDHHDSGPGPDIHQPNDPYHDPNQPPFDPGKPAPFGPLPGDPPGLQAPTNPPTEVPEPLTLSLFAAGLAGLVARRRPKAG